MTASEKLGIIDLLIIATTAICSWVYCEYRAWRYKRNFKKMADFYFEKLKDHFERLGIK